MKLLVTTDFSTNSKAAIRFAQTLAKQTKNVEVVFYYTTHIIRSSPWNDDFFYSYKEEEIERLSTNLKKFVNTVIGKENSEFASIKFVVDNGISTEKNIMAFAEENKIDFICIATRGTSMLRKIIGTHTSYLVHNSKVPVMVIPSHYKTKPLKRATYLSDFENLEKEVTKISKLSNEISIHLDVLHYSSVVLDSKKFESNKELFNTKEFENIKLNIIKNNFEFSLVKRITEYVQKSKPELLIMFTNGEKGFFESIFMPSKSSELIYTTKIPVLIFSK